MRRILAALFIVLLSAILIMGCDGGSELSDPSVNRGVTSEETAVLTGVVAMGEPVQGVVQAINTRGETSDEVIPDADGHFVVELSGYWPILLRLIPQGEGPELFSFAATEGHVNLTPLTHLALYVAVGAGADLEDMYHDWDGSQVSAEDVQMAAALVNANLAPLLSKQGLDPTTYDLFHADMALDSTGMDAVLNTMRVHIDPAGRSLESSIRILDTAERPLLTFDAAAPVSNTAVTPATGQKQTDKSP